MQAGVNIDFLKLLIILGNFYYYNGAHYIVLYLVAYLIASMSTPVHAWFLNYGLMRDAQNVCTLKKVDIVLKFKKLFLFSLASWE